jgi:hypothetical protein
MKTAIKFLVLGMLGCTQPTTECDPHDMVVAPVTTVSSVLAENEVRVLHRETIIWDSR